MYFLSICLALLILAFSMEARVSRLTKKEEDELREAAAEALSGSSSGSGNGQLQQDCINRLMLAAMCCCHSVSSSLSSAQEAYACLAVGEPAGVIWKILEPLFRHLG